ncbi:MAG: bifunctional chorismate mutase/prephenate dehydrogenase, partial [Rhodobacterales bacterium]|nr:bifunctional chorismate mutase/prephenate dehydrogenase [Rhodobacterales bacterium]
MHDIDALRAELDTLNESLVELIARRQEVVRSIGKAKLRSDRPTRDFAREREVLDATRAHARRLGVRPDLAAELMSALIRG